MRRNHYSSLFQEWPVKVLDSEKKRDGDGREGKLWRMTTENDNRSDLRRRSATSARPVAITWDPPSFPPGNRAGWLILA